MEHRYPHRYQHYIMLFVKWSNLCTKGDGESNATCRYR